MTQLEPGTLSGFRDLVPGIYRGIPATEYHLALAVSSTLLKRIHTHSPLHAFDLSLNPIEPTDEMDIGSAAHCLLFTPSEFPHQFMTGGRCEGQTKKKTQCSKSGSYRVNGQWFCDQHTTGDDLDLDPDITILSPDDMARVKGICAAVQGHDKAAEILEAATDHELSIIAECPNTGLKLKARLDIWCGDIDTMPDLKTCRCSKPDKFKYQARDLAYHVQVAFYKYVAAIAGIDAETTTIIAVENTRPHAVTVFEPSPKFMATGELHMLNAMETYAACKADNQWPAYSDKTELLELP